jgi:hypothetical protein
MFALRRFTSVFTLYALFLCVLAVAVQAAPRYETNAQRMARGLAPLRPRALYPDSTSTFLDRASDPHVNCNLHRGCPSLAAIGCPSFAAVGPAGHVESRRRRRNARELIARPRSVSQFIFPNGITELIVVLTGGLLLVNCSVLAGVCI